MLNFILTVVAVGLGVMMASAVMMVLVMNKRFMKKYLKAVSKLSTEVATELYIEGELDTETE